jgi:predicted membrane protein
MDNTNNKIGSQKSKIIIGITLLVVGVVLLLKQLGYYFQDWVFSWPMILIIVGFLNGIKYNFRNSGWFIMLLIGGVFLAEKIDPDLNVVRYTWPIIIIGFGLWFIFSKQPNCNNKSGWNCGDFSKKKDFYRTEQKKNDSYNIEEEPNINSNESNFGSETLDVVSVMGGTKKNILSKNFRGGEVVTVLGGSEINLLHADIQGTVIIEIVQVFGGTKLIVPQSWGVVTEMAAVCGGIDDKRKFYNETFDQNKTLVIKGTTFFGGLEIRSY